MPHRQHVFLAKKSIQNNKLAKLVEYCEVHDVTDKKVTNKLCMGFPKVLTDRDDKY